MTTSASADSSDVRVYGQPGGRVLAVVFVVLAALCAFNSVVVAGGVPDWIRVANIVLVLLILVAVPAQWRAGVTVTPADVRGRLQLGRRGVRLTWSEVHHFEMRGYWKGLCVVTTQGRVRSVMLVGFGTGGVDEVLRQLETYRRQQQRRLGLVPLGPSS